MDIDFGPIVGQAIEIVILVLLAAAAVVGRRLHKWLGLKEDSEVRGYLDQALNNAANAAVAGLKHQHAIRSWNVSNQPAALALAVDYVKKSVPGAVEHFGLDQRRIEQLIEARIARIEPPPAPSNGSKPNA